MPRLKLTPRKHPRQARSRAMVEAILEATIRVLLAKGYEGTTTIAVAARAGVSVGSLYQYFPNKETLVAALVDRHVTMMIEFTEQALAVPGEPHEVIRGLIRAGIESHRIDPALHKILIEQVPRVGRMKTAMDTSRRIMALLAAYLTPHRASLVVRDVEVAAFVVETTIEALTHRVVIERPDRFSEARLEEETAALVLGYLFGFDARVATPSRTTSARHSSLARRGLSGGAGRRPRATIKRARRPAQAA